MLYIVPIESYFIAAFGDQINSKIGMMVCSDPDSIIMFRFIYLSPTSAFSYSAISACRAAYLPLYLSCFKRILDLARLTIVNDSCS